MKHSGDKVRTIGLILEDAFTDFAYDIIHSVSFLVKDRRDIRLVVIPGRQDDSRDPGDRMHRYKQRYNLIYRMNERYHFDGLLLTFPNLSRMQKDIYEGIPKVYLATALRDKVTVNYDDEMGIREAIDYLVKIKGVTRLCMLGGRNDNTDAQKRKRIFRQCLEDNGLSYAEAQYEPADMSTRPRNPRRGCWTATRTRRPYSASTTPPPPGCTTCCARGARSPGETSMSSALTTGRWP